jgi:hypothetical protein
MAVSTTIYIYTRDAQGYTERIPFLVAPSGFGAAVDLPTVAHLDALCAALAGSGSTNGPSTQIIYAYGVETLEDAPAVIGNRNGIVATSIALKTRQGIGISGPSGRFGPEGIEMRLPGYDKAIASVMPNDRNSVDMTNAIWTPVRTALHNLGYQDPAGLAWTTSQMLQSGVIFNGRRGAMRPK